LLRRLRLLRLIRGRVDEVEVHVRSLIHVWENKSGTNGWFSMKTRTAVTMSTSSDLKVERTVNSVFLSSEYRCQMLRHLWLRVSLSSPPFEPPFSFNLFMFRFPLLLFFTFYIGDLFLFFLYNMGEYAMMSCKF
jgi:hypothetical protein